MTNANEPYKIMATIFSIIKKELAKDIVKNIARIENNHQNGMEILYNSMPDTFFKAMRRILPSIYIKNK